MARVPESWSRGRTAGVAAVALAVVVVAVVGGGLPGSGGGDDGTTDPDPTPVANLSEVDLPPGINETGVNDTSALMRSHREYLATRGFRYEVAHRILRGKPSTPESRKFLTINVTKTVAATADLSTHLEIRREHSEGVAKMSWYNGTVGARRIEGDGVSYEPYDDEPLPRLTHHYVVDQWLVREYWNLTGVRADGDAVLRANVTNDFDAARNGSYHVVRGRAVVAPEGWVRSFRIHVSRIPEEWRAREDIAMLKNRTLTYRVVAVGNVSLPPPEWLDEALRETDDDGSASIAPGRGRPTNGGTRPVSPRVRRGRPATDAVRGVGDVR